MIPHALCRVSCAGDMRHLKIVTSTTQERRTGMSSAVGKIVGPIVAARCRHGMLQIAIHMCAISNEGYVALRAQQ